MPRADRTPKADRRYGAGAHTAILLLLGAMMSLFGAIAAAFVRDYSDPAIKSAADAGGATGLPESSARSFNHA